MFVHIKVTDTCNLHCPYCYGRDNIHKKNLSDEDFLRIINTCDKNGVMNITWTGGEPFTKETFVKLVNETYSRNINQTILTNGLLLSKDLVKKIPSDNLSLQISLNDWWQRDEKSRLTHRQILENAKCATEVGFGVIMNLLLADVNIEQYREIINLLISYNLKCVRFGYKVPVGGLSDFDMTNYIANIKSKKNDLIKIRKHFQDSIHIVYQFDKHCMSNELFPKRFYACEAGTTQIFIDNNGDVYPCPLFKSYEEFFCGSVLTNTWNELWNSEPLKQFRKIPSCEGCNQLCNEWCRALVYPTNHTLYGKSPYCTLGRE